MHIIGVLKRALQRPIKARTCFGGIWTPPGPEKASEGKIWASVGLRARGGREAKLVTSAATASGERSPALAAKAPDVTSAAEGKRAHLNGVGDSCTKKAVKLRFTEASKNLKPPVQRKGEGRRQLRRVLWLQAQAYASGSAAAVAA
jgi:hypothetical protein